MADLPIANAGPLTGTTAVTILAAPGASTQRIISPDSAGVYNRDTVSHDITFQKDIGGVKRILYKAAGVVAGGTVLLPKRVVLAATNQSLEALTDATATTTEPDFDVAALETT